MRHSALLPPCKSMGADIQRQIQFFCAQGEGAAWSDPDPIVQTITREMKTNVSGGAKSGDEIDSRFRSSGAQDLRQWFIFLQKRHLPWACFTRDGSHALPQNTSHARPGDMTQHVTRVPLRLRGTMSLQLQHWEAAGAGGAVAVGFLFIIALQMNFQIRNSPISGRRNPARAISLG